MKEYMRRTIETYNLTSKEYAESVKGLCPIGELEKFVNYIGPNKTVLDIGCGSGVAARLISERGYDVTGIDLSVGQLIEAKKEAPQATLYNMDMQKLDFKNNFFDGIWNAASLLHLEKEDIPNALNEANRVLKPKGIMYLSIKGGKGEGLEADKRYGGLLKQYTYLEEREINNFLENANFKVLENYSIQYKDNYRAEHPWINIFVKKQ